MGIFAHKIKTLLRVEINISFEKKTYLSDGKKLYIYKCECGNGITTLQVCQMAAAAQRGICLPNTRLFFLFFYSRAIDSHRARFKKFTRALGDVGPEVR